MHISHSAEVWAEHPHLVAGVVVAAGIAPATTATDATPAARSADPARVAAAVARYTAAGAARLATGPESEFPEIQAWRRAFSRMGIKPTQYRCAAESLLRRYRKEGALPSIHPLIDLCNAISLAFAIPVAALDISRIAGWLRVRPACGDEEYVTFDGEIEHPDRGEVVFVDEADQAHARRWTNRQSGHSAVRDSTSAVLIIAEAMHDTAATDVPALTAALAADLAQLWPVQPQTATLLASAPRFDFADLHSGPDSMP